MTPTENKVSVLNFDSDPILEHIKRHTKAHPERAKSFSVTMLLKITKTGQTEKNWTFNFSNGEVYEGKPANPPHTTITMSDEDFVNVMMAKMDPQQGMMDGKILISGSNAYMHKLWVLLRTTANAKL